MNHCFIRVYTDGSCHTQIKTGAWVGIIYINDKKVILSGCEENTTHNRMELMGILKALDYLQSEGLDKYEIAVYTDSQYAVKLMQRKEKLNSRDFKTKKGNEIRNFDLVQNFYKFEESLHLVFHKVKAHHALEGDAGNREADVFVRNLLRNHINHHGTKHT